MKMFKTVFQFEFITGLKKRAFLISTIILMIIFCGLTFIPRFFLPAQHDTQEMAQLQENLNANEITVDLANEDEDNSSDYGLVFLTTDIEKEALRSYEPFKNAKIYETEALLQEEIEAQKLLGGLVFTSASSYKFIVQDRDIMNEDLDRIEKVLKEYQRDTILKAAGIAPEIVNQAEAQKMEQEIMVLKEEHKNNFFVAYIGLILIYLMVLSYGGQIATSVAKEKSNRAMELLITACPTKYLITGKVFASFVLILIQLSSLVGSVLLGLSFNYRQYSGVFLSELQRMLTFQTFFHFFLFGILGYLMYAFIFAALGALVSKLEDLQNAIRPILMMFILIYFLANAGMGMPNNIVIRIASIFPLTAPLCMFVRSCMTTVPLLEVIIAGVLVILTTIFLAWLSMKIYRMGTLNYGNRMSIFRAVKRAFNK